MTRSSIDQAWRLIRALHPVDAGRLTGHSLDATFVPRRGSGILSVLDVRQLLGSAYPDPGGPITGDSIAYVVVSDGVAVALLTYHAQLIAPPADLTTYQTDHQHQAIAALSQLTRPTLCALARLRDHREGRSPGPVPRDQSTAALAANPADPTLTWWSSVGKDLADTRVRLARVTGTENASDVLIVDRAGYGDFGRGSHPLTVPVLCAIEELVAAHALPAWVIGDWLNTAGATGNPPNAEGVLAAFRQSYIGLFEHKRGFAEAERDRRWGNAFTDAGIPLRLFDLDRFSMELFDAEVRDVHLDDGRVAVFRR